MKKQIILTAAAVLLCGCQPQIPGSSITPEETAAAEEPLSTEEVSEPASVIWIKEPSMKLDSIAAMEAHPFILGASVELSGDPAGWAEPNEKEAGYDVPVYRKDALIASKDGQYGIIDYDGNVLYPLCIPNDSPAYNGTPIVYQPYTGFIVWAGADGAYRFNSSFSGRSFVMTGGLGGYAPSPYVIDHEVWIDDPQTMEAYRYENTFGTRIMAEITDKDRHVSGCAVIGTDSSVLMETPYYCSAFINGVVTVSENEDWQNPGRLGFVSAEGRQITDGPRYEQAGWFSDGCAPVMIDGMWAYIDEEGRQVTDAIFSDASVLHDGRACVQLDGLYGILDLKATLAAGIEINAETCGGYYQEEPLDMPEEPEVEKLGSVRVLVSGLNIRAYPTTDAEKLGKVSPGDVLDVWQIMEASDYTWYMIEPGHWIADGGSWLEYTEN